MGMCPPPDSSTSPITGLIRDEFGDPLVGAAVRLATPGEEFFAHTNENGIYEFPDVLHEKDYRLTADVNSNFRNGITTYDLLMMARYILGLKDMDSDGQYISADVNMSGRIDVIDSNAVYPLALGLETWIGINDVDGPISGLDFFGWKLEDMDYSASGETRNLDTRYFQVHEKSFTKGETFTASISTNELEILDGYQFELNYDLNALEISDVRFYGGTLNGMGNYVLDEDRGSLMISWVHPDGFDVSEDEITIEFDMVSKVDGSLQDLIDIRTDRIPAEVYYSNQKFQLDLEFRKDTDIFVEPEIGENWEVSVFPNPIEEQFAIRIKGSDQEIKTVRLIQMNGQVAWNGVMAGTELELDRTAMPEAGTYILEVSDGKNTM